MAVIILKYYLEHSTMFCYLKFYTNDLKILSMSSKLQIQRAYGYRANVLYDAVIIYKRKGENMPP